MSIVAIVGLGYVGLPLAVEFGKKRETFGYDSDADKIEAYQRGADPSGQVTADELNAADRLTLTSDPSVLANADYIIVAVPTPVDKAHQPDFQPLLAASRAIGAHMTKGCTVIYESTVYPGATEEICIPVLEQTSNMTWKRDFRVGYSPERINPGDEKHRLPDIVKVTSGSTPEVADLVDAVYSKVITA
ncbi:MAG: nucleotide sugar dehydrogenase, partial [Proteobacteria bacterium]|nr:nucleotide sugar dehydrogenase [Pseudomonadota bacterium]